jgi:chromosome partitioning protein
MTSKKAIILAIFNQKGGVGKSTIAIHLAVAAGAHLVDLDPQQSAASWAATRGDLGPDVHVIDPTLVGVFCKQAVKDGTSVVIDTPGSLRADVGKALAAVDFVLVPIKAGALDLWALGATRELLEKSKRPYAAVLSDVPTNRRAEVGEVDEILRNGGWKVAPVRVHNRVGYMRALATGKAVSEIGASGRVCAQEIDTLWRWVHDQVAG